MALYRICFFFNDPATTAIYTYGHTLSLHSALPFYDAQQAALAFNPQAVLRRSGRDSMMIDEKARQHEHARHPEDDEDQMRSEEHTSELQSLMRNSYAVSCLKKKTNNTNITEQAVPVTTYKTSDE